MEYYSTIQGSVDDLKPSLFELLSEQQLSGLLPPTLRYLLAVATPHRPRILLPLLNSFDEVYGGVFLLIERYYLKTYGGSFTEHFYGLKRARTPAVSGTNLSWTRLKVPEELRQALSLRRSDVWKNLAVLVGVPYLRRKLEESYDIHIRPQNAAALLGTGAGWDANRHADLQSASDGNIVRKIRRKAWNWYKYIFLRRIWPIVNAIHYLSILAFNIAYLFDRSRYHDPLLWLIGTRMRRLSESDWRIIAAVEEAASKVPATANAPGPALSLFHPRLLVKTLGGKLAGSLRFLLPASVFALKFLEWWHASDFARQLSRKAAEGLRLPPPVIAALSGPAKQGRRSVGESEKTDNHQEKNQKEVSSSPISAKSNLPILTVSGPTQETSALCPICSQPIQTATASPYGYVYCYSCIHRWVDGSHDVQARFMAGEGGVPGETDEEDEEKSGQQNVESREGTWENGQGRCAVTGRRVLGGTEGLRRVVV